MEYDGFFDKESSLLLVNDNNLTIIPEKL